MSAIGSTHYESNTYWPSLPSKFHARGDGARQRELAQGFRAGLNSLGLARFSSFGGNLGEILMHGGVPITGIPKFVDLLSRWDARQRSGDGAGFVTWARSMSKEHATRAGFDVPTWRFLSEGGEIAEDFVDRCLVALDGSGGDPGLPARVLDAIQAALRRAPARARRGRHRTTDFVPTITYDPHQGLRVRLPPLEHEVESAVAWKVTTGGTVQRRDVPAPWPGDPVTPTWVPLRAPQQHVLVSVIPGDQEWSLPLVDVDEPLLVFDPADGVLIPPRNSLPKGRLWLALPNPDGRDPLDAVEVGGTTNVIEHFPTPHGWEGWTFFALDSSTLEKVRAQGFGERWRYVSTVDRPRLLEATKLDHVQSTAGQPVLTVRPRLLLPGHAGNSDITWTVTVSDRAGAVVVEGSTTTGSAPREVDPWAGVAGRILGEYTIVVRGPLGRGATLRTVIAEGASVTVSIPFRWMSATGGGLEPATVTVTDPDATLELGARDERMPHTLARDGAALDVVVSLPHLSVSVTGTLTRDTSSVPVTLDVESLDGSQLRVAVPSGARNVTLAAVWGSDVLQTLTGQGAASSTSRSFNLAQLADTLAVHRSTVLRIVIDERSTPVAQVRPRRLAGSIEVVDDELRLVDAEPVDGLVAFAYPLFAPWRPALRLEFATSTTTVPIPAALRGEGSATVVLAVDNPWVPIQPPVFPDRSSGNSFDVRIGEIVEPDDPAERGFRTWLAGDGECPAEAEGLAVALTTYSRLRSTRSWEGVDRARSELSVAVRANRERLMEAVLDTESELDDLFRLFVESDVVTVPREAWESSSALWDLAPGLGVIADSDELGGALEDDFLANIERAVGPSGLRIVRDGVDPHAEVGRFNATTASLARRPPDQIAELWRAATVLPTALLDKDSRATASKSLFDVRDESRLRSLIGNGKTTLALANEALTRDFGPHATAPIAARRFQDGWGDLPALSIALALLARGVARGRLTCATVYERRRSDYAQLAALAPKIVQQDLGLAELWITRWEDVE